MVRPTAADTGRGLGAVDDPLGMLLVDALVEIGFVVESWDIHFVRKLVTDGGIPVVEGRCSGPGRVFFVEQLREPPRLTPAVGATLLGNLVPDAPHDDARV